MKKYILIFVLILFYSECFSRSYPAQQFGLGYSTLSGAGLSYQLDVNKSWSLKFNGIIYYFGGETIEDTDFYTVGGLEYQYNFFKEYNQRIYGLIGASYWYFEENSYYKERVNDIIYEYQLKDIGRFANIGAGIGYERFLSGRFGFSIDIGIQFQSSNKTTYDELFDRNPAGTSFTGLSLGFGIRYLFR